MPRDRATPKTTDRGSLARRIAELESANAGLRREKAHAEEVAGKRAAWLAHVSHELRTPMNGILGMTQLALESELNREQREHLDIVWRSADSLLTLVNDILDHSKIMAGKLAIQSIPFNLRDLLTDTVRAMRMGTGGSVALGLETATGVPGRLIGDPGRLRQVLMNLIGNALKFTHEGSVHVAVDIESADNGLAVLHFCVEDTGIGISPEALGQIFEPFEQAGTGTASDYGGTGLGLTISRQLVELMGGAIWVDSTLGHGTKFHFTAEVTPETPVNRQAGTDADLNGLRVMVLSDSSVNQGMLVDALDTAHMAALVVEHPDEAATYLTKASNAGKPYDLVILDMQTNGIPAAAELVALGLGGTKLMYLTPSGQRGDAAACREIGIGAYLTGSVPAEDLIAATRAVATGTPDLVTRHWLREQRRSLRILVADDSETNRLIASKMLEKRGHVITAVADGAEAVAAFSDGSFDAVLLDVEMPVMNGVEAAAEIRALETHDGPRVPIVALTGHVSAEDRARFVAAGMDDLAPKPLQVDAVLALVSRLCG